MNVRPLSSLTSLPQRQFSLDDPQLGRQDIEARGAAAVSGGLLDHNHSLARFLAGG
jgi:hypothetical protein